MSVLPSFLEESHSSEYYSKCCSIWDSQRRMVLECGEFQTYNNALHGSDRDTTRPLFYPQERSSRRVEDLASRLLGLIRPNYLLVQKGLLVSLLKVLFLLKARFVAFYF